MDETELATSLIDAIPEGAGYVWATIITTLLPIIIYQGRRLFRRITATYHLMLKLVPVVIENAEKNKVDPDIIEDLKDEIKFVERERTSVGVKIPGTN